MWIQALAPWAQVATAFVAGCGLIFTGFQIRVARRTAALQSLQKFLDTVTEREFAIAEVERTADYGKQRYAVIEYINFLEVYAAADNGRLLSGVSREIVRDKLLDSIAVIESRPEWREAVTDTITTSATFTHLRRFMRRHRRSMRERRAQIAAGSRDGAQ